MPDYNFSDWLGIFGIIVGALSLGYAVLTNRRAFSAQTLRRQQLISAIGMARFLITDHEVVQELWIPKAGPDLSRWLWQSHEKASDLYILLVHQYLSITPDFSWEDIGKLVQCQVVKTKWQEEQWWHQLAILPGGRGSGPAQFFVEGKQSTHHAYWIKRLVEERRKNSLGISVSALEVAPPVSGPNESGN
jgi:hypothetical protein